MVYRKEISIWKEFKWQPLSGNPLSGNLTKWSDTLKQFVGFCRRIVWVCLTILWGCYLKGIQSIGWTQCYVIFQHFCLNTVVILNYQILIKMVQFLITETKESDMLKKSNPQKSHKRFDKNAPVV